VPTSAILLLSSSAEGAASAADVLRKVGHDVTIVGNPDDAIRRAGEVALVAIDAVDPPHSALEVCAEIRRTPALAGVAVLCISQVDDVEERVRFLEAGADDVLARPFDPRELEARVDGLLIRFQRSRDLGPTPGAGVPVLTRRHLIACASPKGGVGTTTIAVNIATALAARMPNDVAILDAEMSFGQVSTHLNVKPKLTLSDLAADAGGMSEPDLLRTYAEKAEPGLDVIAAPANPELSRVVTVEHVEQILATAPQAYKVLVVDVGAALDERALVILAHADAVVVPVAPEISALKAFHGFLEYLAEDGAVPAKSTFVLNHLFARDMLSMRQIESAIAARVDAELPYDPGLYLKAVNEGIPIVRGAPSSAPARALTRLALQVAGLGGDAPVPEAKKGGLLGGLRRR
jgi:pilus assembly protein CpaE